jgi:hypothetical protein
MPNRAECAISAVVVDPDIAVRPCNDVARNVVGVDEEDWVIVDHLVNAAVPRGDANDAVPIFTQARDRDCAAHCWPVLPTRSVPLEKAKLRGPDPDIALEVGDHGIHLIRRLMQYPGSAVEFRHSAEHRMRQPHVIVSTDENMVHVVPWRVHGNSWPTRYCVHTLVLGLKRNNAPLENCTLTFVSQRLPW